MRIQKLGLLMVVLAMGSSSLAAQLPRNGKIYIEELPLDLHIYLKAEIIKKKVPLTVVPSTDQADYILKGTAQGSEKRNWHEGWLTAEKDKITGAVEIVDKQGVLVWAGEAGDRSIWWGSLKRGGVRQVANRIVKRLKKAVR